MNAAARRSLAIHEAGHALTGLALGVDVRSASIGYADGLVRLNSRRREHRIVLAAGPIAELRGSGLPPPASLEGRAEWGGDAEDLRASVAETFEPADRAAAYRNALECAEIIVRAAWPAIVRVADELLRCSYLDGATLRSTATVSFFEVPQLPLDPHQQRDAAVDEAVAKQRERMLELKIADQRRRLGHGTESWRPLLRAHNKRVEELHQGLHPRARHLHGDPTMTHGQFETSDIGQAGARASVQSNVLTRARQVQAAVLAGRVARGSVAAVAARDALDLAQRGDLGAPLLAELERRMSQGAAA